MLTTNGTRNGTRNDFSSWDGFEDEEDDIENEREVSVPGDSLLGLDDDTVRGKYTIISFSKTNVLQLIS